MAEAVGFVFGALPLLISALEHYREIFKDCRKYARYESTLKALYNNVRLEQALYHGTLKRLLFSELAESQLDDLFPDVKQPGGSGLWRTPLIEQKLRMKLDKQYDTFMDIIGEMDLTIKQLMTSLDLDLGGKPKWSAGSGTASGGYDLSVRARLEWEWRRVRRSFGEEQNELIQDFEKYNVKVAAFVQNNEILAPSSAGRSKLSLTNFDLVHDHACLLHTILEHGWSCNCDIPHNANLQLDQRATSQRSPSFQISFSVVPKSGGDKIEQRLWQETQICLQEMQDELVSATAASARPTALEANEAAKSINTMSVPGQVSPKPRKFKAVRFLENLSARKKEVPARQGCANENLQTSSMAQIVSLCKAIQDSASSNTCLGFLVHPSQKQRASIIAMATPSLDPQVLPLASLLSSGEKDRRRPGEFRKLSRQQRLGIAVTLASAVLQLYNSPWLDERWGKNEIYFFFNGVDEDNCPLIGSPYVSRPFLSPLAKQALKQSEKKIADKFLDRQIINKTLFALGIILIELCLNRPFEELRSRVDPHHLRGQSSIADDYQTANNLIEEVYSKGGDQYGYVVQRCLRCEFGVQDSKKKLESITFRNLVYEGVLAPLKEDYSKYLMWRGVDA